MHSDMEKQLNNLDLLTNHLVYNAGHMDDPGLFDGKMGVCIFLCHLAKKTKNKTYQNLAEKLIEEICEEIHLALVPDFGRGIVGIGWGLEHLTQNGLLDIDANDVLDEFDSFISESFISNEGYDGIDLNHQIGYGVYYTMRLQNPNNGNTLKNKEGLMFILDELHKTIQQDERLMEGNTVWQIPSPIAVLLWLCSQLTQYNRFKAKVGKIVSELVGSANWPKRHSNRLQLLWGISRTNPHDDLIVNADEVSFCIDREQIKLEIKENDLTLQGISGMALLYEQLYKNTNNGVYRKEFEYWKNRALEIIDAVDFIKLLKKDAQIPFGIFARLPGLGLLSGLSGIGLVLIKNDTPA